MVTAVANNQLATEKSGDEPTARGIIYALDNRDYLRDKRKDHRDGLANLINQELKQLVFSAMNELKPQYREALALRCYEEKNFAEIAELMGRSELSARVLFLRAKKSLAKQLSRHGLSKGSLLMALVLFVSASGSFAGSSV